MNLSESYKNRIIELAGIKSNDDDSYSAFMGRKPYQQRKQEFLDSLKYFDDIEDEKIRECLDYFGYESYNDEEEAFDDFKEKIEDFKKLPNPVKLYRVIGVSDKKMIKTNDLGEHWTPYKWNIDGDMLMSIGYENWDEKTKPFVIEAMVPHSEIDVKQTIVQNLSFKNEHERNLKNKGNGAKFIKAYKLKGF